MSDRGHQDDRPIHPAVNNSQGRRLRRLTAYAGYGLGGAVLIAGIILLSWAAVLNGYVKGKIERSFAEAHPRSSLRIGRMGYATGANRLAARFVTVTAGNSTFRAGRISLTGVRWTQFLGGKAAPAEILANARLEATDIEMEFPGPHYEIRCARLRASVPDSELIAEVTELLPLAGDEEFFAADSYRKTRFRVSLPECRVSGLAFGELLMGSSYRARSVHFIRPSFDALTNRDRPPRPFVKSPRMVNEALAAIRQPLHIDSLCIADGYVAFCLQMAAGAAPGALTFTEVDLNAEGITNRGEASAAIRLRAQGNIMDAGLLKVLMTIPLTLADFSLHYSGSLGEMDLTRLGPFISIVEHYNISSGRAKRAEFEITVASGRARGSVRANFSDLTVAVLDKTTGSKHGLDNRIASFLANQFKIRGTNSPEASAPMKVGRVNYRRKPRDTFLQVVWYALKSGVLDVIHQ
jgi:hypothetical protein